MKFNFEILKQFLNHKFTAELPNSHVVGGRSIGRVRDKQDCVVQCYHSDQCGAVDYEIPLSICWFHSPHTACGTKASLPRVIHVSLMHCGG